MDEKLKRFKAAARFVRNDFEDIEKLNREISEIEYEQSKPRASWNFGETRILRDQNRSDLHFLKVMERKDALIEKRDAFEAHIKWVSDVIQDCPLDIRTHILECFVKGKKTGDFLYDLYGSERADNKNVSMAQKICPEIIKVLTPERMAELDRIEKAMDVRRSRRKKSHA